MKNPISFSAVLTIVLFAGQTISGETENCKQAHTDLKDRIGCYVAARADLIAHGQDINRFESIKDEVRGAFIGGSIQEYECGRHISNKRKTPPTADSKGACASKWNKRVYAAKEYYRLRCKIKLPSTDSAVKKARNAVGRIKGEYDDCVTDYFSGKEVDGKRFSHQSFFEFYSIKKNYNSFKKIYGIEKERYKQKYNEDWLDLAENCKKDLLRLKETRGVDYIKRNRVTCAVR